MSRSGLMAGMVAGAAMLVAPGSALAADVVDTTPFIHVQSNTPVVHTVSVKYLSGMNVPGHIGQQHTAYLIDDGAIDMTVSTGNCDPPVSSTDGDGGKDAVCALDDAGAVTSIELDGGSFGDTLSIDPSVPIPATLFGYSGNDTLIGGAHNDTLGGTDGNDTLDGRGGSDYIAGDTGIDTVTYASRTAPVTADIEPTTEGGGPYDDGNSADLSGANHDAIASVENLTGGSAADKLTGGGLANALLGGGGRDVLKGLGGKDKLTGGGGADKLIGAGGNDRLNGAGGNDRLNGGRGRDKLLGKAGKDTLKAKDGKRDKKINCGSGGADKATVDRIKDPTAGGCETVIKL